MRPKRVELAPHLAQTSLVGHSILAGGAKVKWDQSDTGEVSALPRMPEPDWAVGAKFGSFCDSEAGGKEVHEMKNEILISDNV
jgi:hypothetical protein